jgi:predicted permease
MTAPNWAVALLRRVAPPGAAEDLVGDLEEAHRRRVARRGRAVAAVLTAVEALDVAAAIVRGRVRRRSVRDPGAAGRRAGPGTGVSWLDVKMGVRMLIKYPALTLVGGLGMAVAIAVSVGFFAFIGAHIYPVLPLDEGERIVALENRDAAVDNEERRSLHDFVTWREELRSVQDLGAFRTVERNLISRDAPPEPVRVAEMTAAGFRVARVAPLRGRYLVEADERPGAAPVVVIGYDVWQRRFGGDPAVVGRELRVGAATHTVVGVMPETFAFPRNHGIWTPLQADPAPYPRREGPAIYIFGRLAPGVTMERAQAELAAIGRRTAAAFPKTHAQLRPMVMPYTHSLTDIQGTTTWMAVQMQLMVSLLLVVVALNVAVLVYARTATRQGEIAVRVALGASRRRVVAQLFVEALVLSLGAAAVGLGLAQVGVGIGNRMAELERGAPFWASYTLRPATVLFTVAIAVFAAVIVGVLPAMQATSRRLQSTLRQLSGGTGIRLGRTWTVLIVAQVAIAVAALPASVSMGWREIRGALTRPTYAPEEYLVAAVQAELDAAPGAAATTRADSAAFGARVAELLRRVEAQPGVVGATYQATLPDRTARVEVEGVPAPSPSGHRVMSVGVAPDNLDLFDARILAGRGLTAGDLGVGSTAVVVNQAFVTQVLGGARALGRRVRHMAPRTASGEAPEPGPWYQIVGVAEELQVNDADPTLVRPRIIYPVALGQTLDVDVEVRVRGAAAADFAPRLREIAVAVDPALRLGAVHTLDEFEREGQLAVRLVALVVGLVLVSVFLLSAAGVYALASFAVTRRRKEIGIRTALGAHPRQVLRGVLGQVARQIALGLVVGLVAAAVVDRLAGGALMGGRGGVLLPAFGGIMAVVAFLAALGPARRGLRVEPTEALRAEA